MGAAPQTLDDPAPGRRPIPPRADLLGLSFRDPTCRPDEFRAGIGSFSLRIEEGCCGFEGIGLVGIFLGVYPWAFRRDLRFPRALLPIGTAVIWLGNAARIAALVAIGARVSPEVAEGGFHSQAGWISYNLSTAAASSPTPWSPTPPPTP